MPKDSSSPGSSRTACAASIWSGWMVWPVEVDCRICAALMSLAPWLPPIAYLSASSTAASGSTYSGEDVDVLVAGQDQPLQEATVYSSTPPVVSSAPSAKCGRSLLSNIDSAEPMAMCMSRYL